MLGCRICPDRRLVAPLRGCRVCTRLLPEPFTPGRPVPMLEEPPRVVCTAILRAAGREQ